MYDDMFMDGMDLLLLYFFFFSSRRRHTRFDCDWSSDVCSSDLKTIRLENLPHTVVGVMSPEFQYPTSDVQIWTPLTINPEDFQTRTGYNHLAVARLKAGVTVEQAQTEVNVISTRLAQEHPESNKELRFS